MGFVTEILESTDAAFNHGGEALIGLAFTLGYFPRIRQVGLYSMKKGSWIARDRTRHE